MYVFLNNDIIKLEEARVSPLDRGFLFGDGIYEVIQVYKNKLFLYEEHLKRLKNSLKEAKIPFDNFNFLQPAIEELMRANNFFDKQCSVYIQITRGAYNTRTHQFPEETVPTIFIYISEYIPPINKIREGTSAVLLKDFRWGRCDIKTISIIANSFAKQYAIENGCYEVIWHNDDELFEGSHTNFFAVIDNTVITPPLSGKILEGITRNFVLDICKQLGINCKEEPIKKNDIPKFSEAFLTGTITEVMPVIKISDYKIDDKPGELTKLIQEKYFQIKEQI